MTGVAALLVGPTYGTASGSFFSQPTPTDGGSVIHYGFLVGTNGIGPQVYLAHGSDYAFLTANGWVYATESGSPPNLVGGTAIYANTTKPKGCNKPAFQIDNTLTSKAELWINGSSLPSGDAMYLNTSVAWTSGTEIGLAPGTRALVLSFCMKSKTATTIDLLFSYALASGALVVYTYPLKIDL